MSNLLADLNPEQERAVTTTEGPLLVVAGAGAGKTRVITYRIAYLIEQGKARPEEILAVTFTNRAADEMRQRVAQLVPGSAGRPWTSTFHSFCARLLRREAPTLGLPRDFSIYDEDDQTRLVRSLLKEFGEDPAGRDAWVARGLLERISRAKTAGRTPEEWQASPNPLERRQAELFRRYQQALRAARALDFDDLLLEAVRVLAEHPAVRARWRQRFRYLQVDEYQDTNPPQYELIRLLAPATEAEGEKANVCVVGDEDQSIYGWRGADYGNIFRFEKDFLGTQLILLEQNYRSTQPILNVATAVIQNNRTRKGKVLWSERKEGPKVQVCEAPDALAEAQFVAEQLWRRRREDPQAKLAVLYRTNAQSRLYEEALRRFDLPYKVVGGFSFYKRAEVRDLLAYVRAARNPADEQSLLRILNVPPRGIGTTTMERLSSYAHEHNLALWDALEKLGVERLRSFRELMLSLQAALAAKPFAEALEHILRESGYENWLEEQDTPEADGRLENLRELVEAAAESEARGESVEDFLDRAALVSDADDYDATAPVTLMTLHSAKGTEFDAVFLVGLEEGLLPHSRSLDADADIEEERRLCYVGMTRAKTDLYLLRALRRRSWAAGESDETEPSRFLLEVPPALVERLGESPAVEVAGRNGDDWNYEPLAEERTPAYPLRGGRRGGGSRSAGRSRTRQEADAPHPQRHRHDPSYPLGCTVRHAKFGEGTVLAVDGEGADRKIEVRFTNYGRKKLIEKYAALERV
ncbi:MAG TPA: UvrD-helicase domain-containing protein [Candidatus Acidoferrales bacterium]|nr:UvrD-helicase domain-containing protein [Candidatus Acidoferrales bacterium]